MHVTLTLLQQLILAEGGLFLPVHTDHRAQCSGLWSVGGAQPPIASSSYYCSFSSSRMFSPRHIASLSLNVLSQLKQWEPLDWKMYRKPRGTWKQFQIILGRVCWESARAEGQTLTIINDAPVELYRLPPTNPLQKTYCRAAPRPLYCVAVVSARVHVVNSMDMSKPSRL